MTLHYSNKQQKSDDQSTTC